MIIVLVAALAPLTWGRVASAWRFEPGVVAAVVALTGGYGLGVRRWRRGNDGQGWPLSRTLSFAAGVVAIALIGLSFLGVYDDTLFWVRAVQYVVLLMVAPMLLARGAPLTLLRDVAPDRVRRWLSRVLHSGPARMLSAPLAVTVVLVAPLLVLYLTGLYEATLRSGLVSGVVGAGVAAAGFCYFWMRFGIDPTPRAVAHGVTLVMTIVEMIGDAVLGVVLWLGPPVAADWYGALGRDWGPGLYNDQLLGAGALWVGGDVVGLPFILLVIGLMVADDEREAVQIDAELDAAKPTPEAVEGGAPQPSRLWWEDDPQLAPRFRRR